MKTKAVISLKFSSQKGLKSFVEALSPEINHPISNQAKVHLEKKEDFVLLSVDAENTTTLRSTLNAYLHWMTSMAKVVELLDNS